MSGKNEVAIRLLEDIFREYKNSHEIIIIIIIIIMSDNKIITMIVT